MKCYMILVLAVAFSLGNCNAQGQKKVNEKKVEKTIRPNKVKYYFLSQLDGTEWLLHEDSRIEKYVRRTVAFSKTERISHDEYYHPERNTRGMDYFYLSDTIPTSYDEKYVGKVESGRYIVLPGGTYDKVTYWEIQKLTEDSLVLFRKYVPKPRLKNEVIYGRESDVTLRFSRINKGGEEFKQVSKGGQQKEGYDSREDKP